MSAIARYLDFVFGVFATLAAVFFVVRDGTLTGRMRAFPGFCIGHNNLLSSRRVHD
jgi:hypothetical protein